MEFLINKDILLNNIFKIQGIVDKKHTIPILSNVLIVARENGIIITATDLEVGLEIQIHCEIIKTGKISISAKKLFEIIKEMPSDNIHFKSKDNSWVEISCRKTIFNLVGLSPETFPKFPEINSNLVEIENSILKEMIESTIFSVSNDETKYNLNGIFVLCEDYENKSFIKFVSTDGHRLSFIKKETNNNFNNEFYEGFILPKKGISELRKVIENDNDEIKIGTNEKTFFLKNKNITFVMRMIDGDFPDYNKVIPLKNENFSYINKDLFLHALKRISVLSSEKSKGVKLLFNKENLTILSSNPDLGDAKEEMDIEYSGSEISIGFNARYIIDILNIMKSDNIKFYLKDNISPGMITSATNEDFLSVIMPMRL